MLADACKAALYGYMDTTDTITQFHSQKLIAMEDFLNELCNQMSEGLADGCICIGDRLPVKSATSLIM